MLIGLALIFRAGSGPWISRPLERWFHQAQRSVQRDIGHALDALLRSEPLNALEDSNPGFYLHAVIGDYLFEGGDYPEAERHQRKASQWSDTHKGPKEKVTADRLAHWVETLYFLDAYQEALPLAERCLNLSQSHYGPESPEYAERESILALIESYTDHDTEAVLHAHHALSILIKAQGLGDEDTIELMRRYAEAGRNLQLGPEHGAEIAKIALALSERFVGLESVRTETLLNDLDWYFRKQGDCETARRYAEASLEITVNIEGADTSEAANRFHSLGTDEYCAGDIALAIQHTEHALAISRKIYGASHSRVAYLEAELSDWTEQAGQIIASKSHAQSAIRILDESLGDDHPQAPDVFDFVGTASLQWDPAWSRSFSKRYLRAMQRLYGKDDIALVDPLTNLANAELIDGDLTSGLMHARRAVELTLGYARSHHTLPDGDAIDTLVLAETTLHHGNAAESHALMALHYAELESGLNHPYTSHAYQQLATTLYARRPDLAIALLKRAILLEHATLPRITASPEENEHRREDLVTPLCTRLYEWLIDQGRAQERNALSANFTLACDQGSLLTMDEAEWLERRDEIARKILALDRPLRRLLKQGEHGTVNRKDTLLEAHLSHRSKEHERALQKLFKQPLNSTRRHPPFRPSDALVSAIKQRIHNEPQKTAWLHYDFEAGRPSVTFITEKEWQTLPISGEKDAMISTITASDHSISHARRLYDILIAPVRAQLDEAMIKALLIDHQGLVTSVSFTALHDNQGFLSETHAISYLEGASPSSKSHKGISSIALFGTKEAQRGFNALPNVYSELHEIDAMARDNHLQSTLIEDQGFTAAHVRKAVKHHAEALHFATHFIPSPGAGEASSLLTGEGSHLTTEALIQSFDNTHPPFLITLSVCDTSNLQSATDMMPGEAGLMQRLAKAGVSYVIGSLWPIKDVAARQFMVRFYAHLLNEGRTIDDAMVATLAELRLTSHPVDWGGFALIKR
jgi:CHAT domain-containing protein/tetratricopeptide (TPR) repeat protein